MAMTLRAGRSAQGALLRGSHRRTHAVLDAQGYERRMAIVAAATMVVKFKTQLAILKAREMELNAS